MGWGKIAAGLALPVVTTGMQVHQSMREGDSFGTGVGKAVFNFATDAVLGSWTWGLLAADVGYGVIQGGYNKIQERKNWMQQNYRVGPQFNYVDTEAAYTMRQAGVQAIQGSKLNARSALGGEARLMGRREGYNRI